VPTPAPHPNPAFPLQHTTPASREGCWRYYPGRAGDLMISQCSTSEQPAQRTRVADGRPWTRSRPDQVDPQPGAP
jgi:hypothetical protein